jgi:hypothetical protein
MHPIHRLQEIARAFHHERAERQRQPLVGTRRRKHAQRLEELEEAFERMAAHWLPDEGTRRRWRDYLSHGGEQPEGPEAREPLLFCGRSSDGGTAEVRRDNGRIEILVDGRLVGDAGRWNERTVTMGDTIYRETTHVPEATLSELRAHLRAQAPPPWPHALELYEDGIVDENFSLTDRGRRVLAEHELGEHAPPPT